MGLFDFFKPKWKRKNPEVRLDAVQALGAQELRTLKDLAAVDDDRRVRLAAVERIADRAALEELSRGALDPETLGVVRAKLDRSVCEEALAGAALPGLDDALARLDDLALVERLAAGAPTPALRVRAVERLSDQEALCRVVETNCGKEAARVALAKIDREPLLQRIARNGASKVSRRLAEDKLAALAAERARPVEEERKRVALEALADEGTALALSNDWEGAPKRFAALATEWSLLDPSLAHPRHPSLAAARQRFETRREEWVRTVEEQRRKADAPPPVAACAPEPAPQVPPDGAPAPDESEAERLRLDALTEALSQVDALLEAAKLEPARRALADVERRTRVEPFRQLDPAPLLSRLEAAKKACEDRLAAKAHDEARVRREAVATREALCAELEGLVDAEERSGAGRRVRELRAEWTALGPPSDAESKALAERYRAAGDRFAVRQAAFVEQQDWLRWNNKRLKEELCAEMEALEGEQDLALVADRVKEGQRRWKELGPVPKTDADTLWQRFKAACDRSYERCKPHLDQVAELRAASLERREELCREAEGHVESTQWKESADQLKLLQARWKEAGPVPRARDEELYARFRQACDRFFERRQAHLAQLDEGRQGVQAEKEKLCEQAEALAAAPERSHVRAFRDLQAAWKRLGPAPRDVDKALWTRFRASCDGFFAWLDAGRRDNLRQKEALCDEVEALMAGVLPDGDNQSIADRLAELQSRWNEVGPVPREQEDEIWDRFHKPCDAFFAARAAASPEPSSPESED